MSKKLVFVVDDDPLIRHTLHRFLSGLGLKVMAMDDGFDVLVMCQKFIPDLIVTDIRMPELDGLTLLEGLKNRDETRDIPVIFISAYCHDEAVQRAKGLGAKFLLEKPFSLDRLQDLVEEMFAEEYTIN
jgi:CheY-like chemotaxis protein